MKLEFYFLRHLLSFKVWKCISTSTKPSERTGGRWYIPFENPSILKENLVSDTEEISVALRKKLHYISPITIHKITLLLKAISKIAKIIKYYGLFYWKHLNRE